MIFTFTVGTVPQWQSSVRVGRGRHGKSNCITCITTKDTVEISGNMYLQFQLEQNFYKFCTFVDEHLADRKMPKNVYYISRERKTSNNVYKHSAEITYFVILSC